MKRFLLTLMLSLSLALGLAALATPAEAQGFDISKGIVGNLASEACRERGDCGWCDFVDLMVVIQKVVLYLFGGLALCMLIWGGFGIVTSAGNQEKITGGRKTIISTLFGVLIILAAYFLTAAILGILTKPTSGQLDQAPLSGSWWKSALKCYTPLDGDDYCATNADGTMCYKNNNPFVCNGGQCNGDACKSTRGLNDANASCGPITRSSCNAGGLRQNCKYPDCALNVCDGGSTNVCCK